MDRSMTMRQQEVAVMCLQAQRVAGLPAAVEGRRILLLLQQQHTPATQATATCRGGVAAFHGQVILLHCAPLHTIGIAAFSVAVTVAGAASSPPLTTTTIDLQGELRHPSPRALRFVLGQQLAVAGAVLSLTLHHRRMMRRTAARCCLPSDLQLFFSCCLHSRMPMDDPSPAAAQGSSSDDDDQSSSSQSQSSSGFITIEKGTISRRRPPSDNLLTTDDDDEDECTKKKWSLLLADEVEVEEEFLAMLDDDLYLDALVKDAEAELAARRR